MDVVGEGAMLHKNELGHLFEHIPASQRRAKDGGGLGTTKQLVIGWGTCAWSDFHYNTIDKPSYSLCTARWARLGSIKFILLIHYRDFQTYCMHRYYSCSIKYKDLAGCTALVQGHRQRPLSQKVRHCLLVVACPIVLSN